MFFTEANRGLLKDLKAQRLALAKYRLGVFVQRISIRLQLSELFRWRQVSFKMVIHSIQNGLSCIFTLPDDVSQACGFCRGRVHRRLAR